MSDPLQRLGRRVGNDPHFLASLLAEYANAEGLDDAGLARELGCTEETLAAVRLCRAPRSEAAGFREDVQQVAGHFGLDAARLREVLRQGDAFRLLRGGQTGEAGVLMAARDRTDEPPPSPGGERP